MKEDFEKFEKDFLNMSADIIIGKQNQQTIESVNKNISKLNAVIDAMPNEKTIEDYQLMALTYQYYRFRHYYLLGLEED